MFIFDQLVCLVVDSFAEEIIPKKISSRKLVLLFQENNVLYNGNPVQTCSKAT